MRSLVALTALLLTTTSTYADRHHHDDDDDDSDEKEVAGAYDYNSVVTINLTAPAKATQTSRSKGKVHVTLKGVNLTFTWADNGYVCSLPARLTRGRIKFTSGTLCEFDEGANDIHLNLITGTGEVKGDDVTMYLSWRITGVLNGQKIAGTADQKTTMHAH